ncbi:mercuric reductase [Tolypothrix sp. FACHB-123]|uniref:mercuric reductase n=1 Tax=Tolypothrix sp. FACHB-123 TaxID=2692868 RepID=UPI0016869E21|nr:mercuric reductase [Tolypothrix sp. FACHB-123]MBD2354402.1 mercuric reductase [Tolypothrix sp. FACHB-123]
MSNLEVERVTVRPMDEYNQTLVSHVHPQDWVNPEPAKIYDLVVIGAGTAGLVVAAGAAGLGLGLKVALIEKHLMGGDCLNVGCVPSKTIIRSARVIGELWDGKELGINIPKNIDVDFSAVMARMRRIRAGISPHDSAARFQKLGVDVFLGSGRFTSKNTVEVDGQILRFKKAVIATGARAAKPEIPGIEKAGYLTNESVFSLIQKPERLAVIGGGPIGCELAQAFRRLGCEVVLFHRSSHILNKEDAEAAEILQKVLIKEGIRLVLNAKLEEVVTVTEGKRLYFSANGHRDSVTVDEILVGAGRAPNVEGLNLEAVNVEYDQRQGVKVNDYLQTTNPKIYAAGDICMNWKFTHAADAAARIVIKNTLFSPFGLGRSKLSNLIMPWVTYTDPEIAHVGISQEEAKSKGIDFETIKIPFSSVDRAIADGEESGFLKILHRKGSDEIIGATIVARHAGEMISEVTTAIVGKLGLNKLSGVIHPYPTQAEAIKKAADAYRRTLLTENTKRLLGFLTKLS